MTGVHKTKSTFMSDDRFKGLFAFEGSDWNGVKLGVAK